MERSVGVFEEPFAKGTQALAKAIAASDAYSIAGGGDTVAAIHKFKVAKKIDYISTAGGAFLEFLEGKKLPAVAALKRAMVEASPRRHHRPGPARDHCQGRRRGRGRRIDEGLCTIFVRHTSASLVIQENADPTAKRDLERWLARLVPEGDPFWSTTLRDRTTCRRTSKLRSPRPRSRFRSSAASSPSVPGRASTSGSTGVAARAASS